jgi:hypothetical protein
VGFDDEGTAEMQGIHGPQVIAFQALYGSSDHVRRDIADLGIPDFFQD